ncbi:MAG: copper resistance protein NlpE N-terminal domain-containing protein [Pseudohongiellaceae bacterium]|nr:copper resistance protein NlpE N-terminal domain-containing protein [Pseudohongiellaceae bacterium]
MKKLLAFASLCLCLTSVQTTIAAESETYYDPVRGVLVIPHLVLGSNVFHVTFSLDNPETLSFVLDAQSIADITPTEESLGVSADAIIGTWTGDNGDTSTTLEFRSDGSYTLDNVLNGEDDSCQTGTETGTYTWEPSTSVLVVKVETDTNLQCGLSHPDAGGETGGVFRAPISGDTLLIGEVTSSETATLTRAAL